MIFDNVKQAINIFINHSKDIIGLETLNLLIILTMLPERFKLHESKLEDYFNHLTNSSETNDFYFRWITCMLYISDQPEYDSLREKILVKAEDYLLNSEDMFISTEYFLMYFDYMACPYIDKFRRATTAFAVKKNTHHQNRFDLSAQLSTLLANDFIVSWRDPMYLKNSLEKKEYLFPYG